MLTYRLEKNTIKAMPKTFKPSGFTLIELLIVVSIIGILSGIVVMILNPTVQRNRAKDGVRIANMAKLAQAIEAYNASEGSYAPDKATLTSSFVQTWPVDSGLSGNNVYLYNGASCSEACLSVQMGTSTNYFKYVTGYSIILGCGSGGSSDKVGLILHNCATSCQSPFDLTLCIAP